MNKLKLFLISISPFIIGKLFSYLTLEFEFIGVELSILSILFCVYWFYMGYKSHDYGKSAKESILLGNGFAMICILLIVIQKGFMGRYMFNVIGLTPQTFYLPMIRVSSWIDSLIHLFISFTSRSIFISTISLILMMTIFYLGYKKAKIIDEGR